LDDHHDGSSIAARLHLSRYHLDRLMSSDRTVLEIAVEAGYASHEAFTRAFQRAYGVAPTRWRAAPRQIQLPSASQVNFHPPAGLRLHARNEVTPMGLLSEMVEHQAWLVA
jgi:AraC family transcriptional regulator